MNILELQHHIDMLYRNNGQRQMETALALWYLKKAPTESCLELKNESIKKAQALDPENLLLYSAEQHCRKKNFKEASDCYLKAFARNPGNRSSWPLIGEFILRHGTTDEIVDFYTRVASMDRKNHLARYVLDCFSYFDTLKQEIRTSMLCAAPGEQRSTKLLMQVVFWGAHYTNILIEYLLPALCAPANLPALSKNYQIHFVIFTDFASSRRLQQHPMFLKIKKYCYPHIITFSKYLFKYANDFSKMRGGRWNIPVTLLTNAAYYSGLECGRQFGCYVLNLCPDHILSDRFMTEMASALTGRVDALAGPVFRLFNNPSLLNEIESKYRSPQGTLGIPSQEMIKLLMNYFPEPNFINAAQFSNYPIYLCWRVGDEGIIAHVNHYHPWIVRGNGLRGAVQLSLDPFDGYFLDRNMVDKSALSCAPIAMMCFDLGNNPLCLPTDGSRFNPAKVAQWLRPFLTPVHEQCFKNPLFYNLFDDTKSPAWAKTASQAENVIKEIIADAKKL